LVAHRLVLDVLFLVKLDAHGLKVLKFWGGVAVIGFVAYVAYSHIGASSYRHNAEQQIAKCELKGMDTHTMGMKLTLAYCMQAAGYKFEPLDPDCEKLMDTGNPSCWLGAIEDPCGGRQATIEPQASKCKAANLLLFQLERVCAV
jgi:hypothetical protein